MSYLANEGRAGLWSYYGSPERSIEEVDCVFCKGDLVMYKDYPVLYTVTGFTPGEVGNAVVYCGTATFREKDLRLVCPAPVVQADTTAEDLVDMPDFVATERADTAVEDMGLRVAQDFCEEAWETHGGLIATLLSAAAQAASGKGLERHGSTERNFESQPIFGIPDLLGEEPGRGWQLGQAMKKIQEAQRFLSTKVDNAPRRAVAELLGAIVYTAAAVMTLDDQGEE